MWKGIPLCLVLFITSTVQGEIYRWRDEQGNLQFSDKPPSDVAVMPDVDKVKLTPLNEYKSVPVKSLYPGRNYLAEEKQAKSARKEQRLRQEKADASEEKKKNNCRKARENMRLLNLSGRTSSSLTSLMKKRQRKDVINDQIKHYCY